MCGVAGQSQQQGSSWHIKTQISAHFPHQAKLMLFQRLRRLAALFGCKFRFPASTFDLLGHGNCAQIHKEARISKIRISVRGSGCSVTVANKAFISNCLILIRGDGCKVIIGENCSIKGDVVIICEDNFSSIHIGSSSELYGPISIAATEGTKICIEDNCMIAPGCSIRSGDSHSIFKENARINSAKDIKIESRCWLGERAMVLMGAIVPEGCVVGAATVVTRPFQEKNCILAGVPARVVHQQITWSKER